MLNEYHIWELVPNAPYRIRVELSDEFLKKLVSKLPTNKTKTIRALNKTKYAINVRASYARYFNWFKYKDVSMPLWAAMGLTELANLSLEEMERCIVLYKHKTLHHVCIKNPKLPLKFDPVFVSLTTHFCFDGSLPRDGKGAYYSQKNQLQIDNFIAKVKNCFGEVYITTSLDGKGIPKIRLPRLVGDICKRVCKFESFGTFSSTLSPELLNLSKDYLLAILVSAIVDEGHVATEYIQIGLSNKQLINDLKNLCEKLNYSCSQIKKHNTSSGNPAYYFYLKSIKVLHNDLEDINSKYNLLNLTFKIPALNYLIKAKDFPSGKHTSKFATKRRNFILENLDKVKTLRELSLKLQIPARSLRRHLKYLEDNNKIIRTDNSCAPPLIQCLS